MVSLTLLEIDPAVSGFIHRWAWQDFASVTTATLHAEPARGGTRKGPPEMISGGPQTAGCGVRFLGFQHSTCNRCVPIAFERSLRPEVRLMPSPQFYTIRLHSAPTPRAAIWLIGAIPCPEASVARSTCRYVAIANRATIERARWRWSPAPRRWWSPTARRRWSPAPYRWTPVIPWRRASPVRTWRWSTPTRGWWSEGIGRTGWQGQRAKCGKDQCYGDRVDEFHDRNSCRKSEGR